MKAKCSPGCCGKWNSNAPRTAGDSSTSSARPSPNDPLRDLLIEAIRYGDDPARQAENERIIDTEITEGTKKLIAERALAREALDPVALDAMRRAMDEARARKLQPHYIRAFFTDAFAGLGGRIAPREAQRYQINHVPAALRQRQRLDSYQPLATSYERVTFEPACTMVDGTRRRTLGPRSSLAGHRH